MNRRELLTGLVAVPLAASLPTLGPVAAPIRQTVHTNKPATETFYAVTSYVTLLYDVHKNQWSVLHHEPEQR